MTLGEKIQELTNNGWFTKVGDRLHTISKSVNWEIGGLSYNQTAYVTLWNIYGQDPQVLRLHMNDLGKLEWALQEKIGE